MKRKLIVFEANEIPFKVIDRFCQLFPNSCLAKTLSSCTQFVTYDDSIERGRTPQPTFSWPSIHRGVNDPTHQIYSFNQELSEVDEIYPPIWKILTSSGIKVGLLGAFHSYQSFPETDELKENYTFYVPDVFSQDGKAYPGYLQTFQDYNLKMTRASARNVDRDLQFKKMLKILGKAHQLGIRPSTIWKIATHLIEEKYRPWISTRRRNHQVTLSFDIFLKHLKRSQPDYAIFFANNIAAAMHRYWAATFPEDFATLQVDRDWIDRYAGEIDRSVLTFDRCLKTLISYVDRHPEYKLICMGGIGQAAREAVWFNSELYITDWSRFMNFMGVETGHWRSIVAMIPMFNVLVSPECRSQFRSALQDLRIDGKTVDFREQKNGMFAMCLGQANLSEDGISFRGKRYNIHELGMENVEIEDRSSRSGYHIPTGSLWIYDPLLKKPQSDTRRKISTLDICPSLLSAFQIPVPAYMKGNLVEALL